MNGISLRHILSSLGAARRKARLSLLALSLKGAAREKKLAALLERLREIEPEVLPASFPRQGPLKDYWELKRRLQHAFQCSLMLRALDGLPAKVTVADIGASGIHLHYLRELTRGSREIRAVGVNLDPAAVEGMRARGQEAVLCRGEEMHRHLGGAAIGLFTSFETIEHLHNPALFFRRLARHFSCTRMVISTPYQRRSRVGLFHVRHGYLRELSAEDEHIFELSPGDWKLLLLHAGWKTVHDEICFQYPARLPLAAAVLSRYWRHAEFEGFWGAILEKEPSFSDRYRDWEDEM